MKTDSGDYNQRLSYHLAKLADYSHGWRGSATIILTWTFLSHKNDGRLWKRVECARAGSECCWLVITVIFLPECKS